MGVPGEIPGKWPRMGGPWGRPKNRKKWPKLSRLGELLNTQKNVHFFPARAPARGAPGEGPPGGPRRGSKRAPPGAPLDGGSVT